MLVTFIGMAALVTGSADALPKQVSIAEHLDLTSFPNSTGPRRRPGARTPADYGFTQVEAREGWTVLRENGTWEMAVRLLSSTSEHLVICFSDTAQNGGTYKTMGPLRIQHEHDGLFRAAQLSQKFSTCPAYPKDR